MGSLGNSWLRLFKIAQRPELNPPGGGRYSVIWPAM